MLSSARTGSSFRSPIRPVIASKPAVVATPVRRAVSSFIPAKARLVELDGLRTVTPPPIAKPEPTIINQKLFDYLKAHPELKTVQNLVNETWKKGTFSSTCKDLGLDENAILKYRSAALMDFAVRPPPGDGTAPRTVADANRSFITQYQDDTYNRESTNTWSNNCGPTCLAMVLSVNGKLPQGLTPEQSIDYARGLMSRAARWR